MTIHFARGRDIHDNKPQRVTVEDFAAFVDKIDADRAAEKAGAGYICGPLNGDGRRCAEGAEPRRWLALDLDRIADRELLADISMWLCKFSHCAWETHSSTPAAPRARFILELDRDATRDECISVGEVLGHDLADEFGQSAKLDPSTFRGEQPVFVPPVGAKLSRFEGAPLCVDAYLAASHQRPQTAPDRPETREHVGDDLLGRLDRGEALHDTLLALVARMAAKGLDRETIKAAAVGLLERARAARGARVDQLAGDELRRMIDGALSKFSPSTQIGHEQHKQSQYMGDWATHFNLVEFADLAHTEPQLPEYWWQGLMPAGTVTLLGSHGGIGKSLIGLMLAVCVATGKPLFGHTVKRGIAAYFSAEDAPKVVLFRLRLVCRLMGVDIANLDGCLHLLDATDHDAALFHEVNVNGRRIGTVTPSYEALRSFVGEREVDVLVIDNASDVFDASEIDRARVRGFMRALSQIARDRDRAVMLLVHINRATAVAERAGSEGYSGSTAWHNSARSRLFLSREKDGRGLKLEHQKSNYGLLADVIDLEWPEHEIPKLAHVLSPVVQNIANRNDAKALLKLLHEFYGRAEWVAVSTSAHTNAHRLLSGQKGFPVGLKAKAVFDLLRDAERDGVIERQTYRTIERKDRERWGLTVKGCDLIGVAPTAPTAPTYDDGAHGAHGAADVRQPRQRRAGGVGDGARAHVGAKRGRK